MRLIAIALGCHALCACGHSGSDEEARQQQVAAAPFDEDLAGQTALDQVADQTFDDVGDTSICTEDCSGHDAGFKWGKEQEVTDSSECSGNSASFLEGCETYAAAVEEKIEQARAAAASGEESEG